MRIPALRDSPPALHASAREAARPAPTVAESSEAVDKYDAASLFAIVAFTTYVTIALWGPGGRLLTLTYPIGCAVVALVCYLRSPSSYITFVWWVWLLTPFARRVFDLRFGFHLTSTLLIGPLVATSMAFFTIIIRWRMLRSSAYASFLVAAAALAYAYLIGIVRQSPSAATYDLLTWTAPLAFGLHLALEWRRFPMIKETITPCVLWGLVVTSLYAIWQWVNPPLWDRFWVVSAEMYSVGAPLPFIIRSFSTLNAPGPFTIMLVFSLLIGLATKARWRFVALAIGLVAFILTKGRSAWGAFLLGTLVMQLRQPLRSLPRQWIALIAVLLLAAPIITQPRIMSTFTGRAASFANIENDDSFQSRVSFTRRALVGMTTNPAGTGLGALGGASKLLSGSKVGFAFDSGPLEIFGVMGWLGGALFSMSIFAIILPIFRTRYVKFDPITSAAVSVVVAIMFASLFGNIFTGVQGFFYWSAVGIASAGRTYEQALEIVARFANFVPKDAPADSTRSSAA